MDNLLLPGKPNEWEAKQLLTKIGIRVPKGILLPVGKTDREDLLAETAKKGIAFPCVVKVCSGDIIHKTEHNGVRLGVHEADIEKAVSGLRESFPGSPVLIEEMVSYGGFEFILGVLEDPGFGPAVMAGAGGILTELYRDVAFRLAPCSVREARRMLEELRIYPVLSGYRNIDMDHRRLADIIVLLSDFSLTFSPGGRQIDINPIVWNGSDWIVLDAKAVMP